MSDEQGFGGMMGSPIARFSAFNPLAAATLAIVFLGALAYGANSAAGAALLACALLLVFAGAAAIAPSARLRGLLGDNWTSLLAIAGFCAFGLFGAFAQLPGHGGLGLRFGAAHHALAPYRALEGLSALTGPLAAFGLGALSSSGREGRDWTGRWVCVFALLYCCVGIFLFFSGDGQRLDVGISSANAAATLFGVLAIMTSALLVRAARGRLGEDRHIAGAWRWLRFGLQAPLSLAALIGTLSCLLLTASRGGLVATLAGFCVFLVAVTGLVLRKRGIRVFAAIGPVFVCLILAGALFLRGGEAVSERFALAKGDLALRQQIAAAHWRYVEADPWFGSGLGGFFELNTLAATPQNWQAVRVVGATHNIYIQTLEEVGAVGLILLVLAILPLLLRSIAKLAQAGSGAEWSAALLGASTLVLMHGLVDFGLEVPAIAALYGFLLGAFAGAPTQPSRG